MLGFVRRNDNESSCQSQGKFIVYVIIFTIQSSILKYSCDFSILAYSTNLPQNVLDIGRDEAQHSENNNDNDLQGREGV